MRDLFTEPLWKKDDLGHSIPDSLHAVSVCLPHWQHVIGYEEGDKAVLDQLETGYPRFVAHPDVAELFLAARDEFCKPNSNEMAMVFPSLGAAWRCADYVKQKSGTSCKLESYGWENFSTLIFPQEAYPFAWKYWMHTGEIVSSRNAEAALADGPVDPHLLEAGDRAREVIRARVAEHLGEKAGQVFLFSCGMGAISALHRCVTKMRPDLATAQVEFPYVDLMKIQQEFNPAGLHDISVAGDDGGLSALKAIFDKGESLAAVYTEAPSNPLLRTADLVGIRDLLRENGVPFTVDDSVATSINIDAFQFADVVMTSLTKTFSGVGDVMGGSISLRKDSPFAAELAELLAAEESSNPLFALDAIVLEENSRHYAERVEAINDNAEIIFEFLEQHPAVERVYYPIVETPDFYETAMRNDESGYSGLMSILLKNPTETTPPFYDALPVTKGPSFGTNFTLACPYTMLAHYKELDWVAERGVDANLLRIWIGLEEPEDLISRFETAFAALES